MTIHAAKGLEAPIVFLPDTIAAGSQANKAPFVLWEKEGRVSHMLYLGPRAERTDEHNKWLDLELQRTQADDERLLYVALTRAQERVYVGGVLGGNRKEVPKKSWYGLLHQIATEQPGWVQVGEDWIYKIGNTEHTPVKKPAQLQPELDLNGWDFSPLQVSTGKILPDLDRGLDINEAALEYGTAVHAALDIGQDGVFSEEIEAVVRPVFNAFPEIFDAYSLSEVSITLDDGQIGRMDRVRITEQNIDIYDFKTDANVPHTLPKQYQKQVRRYMMAMQRLYPEHKVNGYIIWTKTASIMPIDE